MHYSGDLYFFLSLRSSCDKGWLKDNKYKLVSYILNFTTLYVLIEKANTVVIKKPLKEGMTYGNPKMYRPIALLSTLGKALEIFFARTITRIAEERHLLPNQQIGARKNRSTELALETLTDAIHTIFGCGKKHVASLISLNVLGAFNHVSHPRLIHNLRMKGLPAWVIRWVESFLTNRETSLTLNYKISEIKPIQTSIP